MREDQVTVVRVEPAWDSWQSAEVHICDLEDIHWHQPPGAPQQLLHGYIWCDRILSGSVPHDCCDGLPHRLRVCVIKKHVLEPAYMELVRRGYLSMGRPHRSERPAARRLSLVMR